MKKNKYGCDISISFRRIDVNDEELLQNFKCEDGAIADFIKKESLKTNDNVSYIFLDDDANRVICFCSIHCTAISTTKFDHKGNPFLYPVPTIEISFFAVDEDYRGLRYEETSDKNDTLSCALFYYMLSHIKSISIKDVGATHVCLYSVPNAINFYRKCQFKKFEEYMSSDEYYFVEGCTPMFCTLNDDFFGEL